MEEIKYELSKENHEKKVVARNAHKRAGRSRKCTLPYEMMSKEERKKYMQASEVTVFKLRPMTLKEYNEVAGDKKRDLLMWYGEQYGWNPAGVAAGLNADYSTGRKKLEEYMLLPTFKARDKALSKEAKKEQLERRKALLETLQQASNSDHKETPEIQKKATQSLTGLTTHAFYTKNGKAIAFQLRGIAGSLDPDEIYEVELTVRTVGQMTHQESETCHKA